MPHFSQCCPGADDYICQVCGKIRCAGCKAPVWRPDITGHTSAGNVCPTCLKEYRKREVMAGIPGTATGTATTNPYPESRQHFKLNHYR